MFKVNEVLKTQPPTYKIEDINGELIEDKYYKQELLKSEFDFESNNKVLESLNINLSVNKYKDDKKLSAGTISKYNQLKQEFDNNKFNQNITNIQLDEMFTTGVKEFKEVNKKTNCFIDEALLVFSF